MNRNLNDEGDDGQAWGELKRSILVRLIPRMRSLANVSRALPRLADGDADFPENRNMN